MEKIMESGVAMNMLLKDLKRCKTQMQIDILWMEGNKVGTPAHKLWGFMNDTTKQTVLNRFQAAEENLK